jgi:hypothetical protein
MQYEIMKKDIYLGTVSGGPVQRSDWCWFLQFVWSVGKGPDFGARDSSSFGALDLRHLGIVNHDLHDAVAERFNFFAHN